MHDKQCHVPVAMRSITMLITAMTMMIMTDDDHIVMTTQNS